MKISEKLTLVQTALNVPKNQTNKFGGYKYRNIDDIFEAVKPLLQTHGLTLLVTDSIELVGDRYYVRATARLTDGETEITNTAYARESLSRKGMDDAQVTGTSSTYARKYALGGLFLLDDNQDVDSMPAPRHEESKKPSMYPKADFDKNFPAWQKLIEKGTHTADEIVDKCVLKGALTPDMIKQLKSVKKVEVQGE